MNILLKIVSFWLPDFILKRELDKIALSTINGLDKVLKQYALSKMWKISDKEPRGGLEERRASMAIAHNKRVKALIKELRYENAIKLGRETMFKVGYKLGCEARQKFRIGDNLKDLELAAKILYKILGIEFKIETRNENMIMIVNRCFLSKYYSPEACIVLSAADEGMIHGLNENMKMQFKKRITSGAPECIAHIDKVK